MSSFTPAHPLTPAALRAAVDLARDYAPRTAAQRAAQRAVFDAAISKDLLRTMEAMRAARSTSRLDGTATKSWRRWAEQWETVVTLNILKP